MIDLKTFCAKEEGRYKINEPFFIDGWQYATDGRFCVRIKDIANTPNTENAPKANAVFPIGGIMDMPHIPIESAWFIPMKDADSSARYNGINCPYCAGMGKESKDCPHCEGECIVECETCGHEDDCAECHGKGKEIVSMKPCAFCANGTKYADVRMGDQYIDGSRLKYMMNYLPNLEPIPASYKVGAPIAFVFDGGQAVLMPLVQRD